MDICLEGNCPHLFWTAHFSANTHSNFIRLHPCHLAARRSPIGQSHPPCRSAPYFWRACVRVPFMPRRQRMRTFLWVPSMAITMVAARRAKCCYRPCYFICIAYVTHKCILPGKDSLSTPPFLCLYLTPERTRFEYFGVLLYNPSYAPCTHVFGHAFIRFLNKHSHHCPIL